MVFSDAFDDRWTARQNGTALTHLMVNGYANGWLVPNPRAGDVVLVFAPQRPFTLGMSITFALVFLALAVILVILTTSRRASVTIPPVPAD